jgi:predicted Na+-dependent transporter
MGTTTSKKSSVPTIVMGVALAAVVVVVYWFSTKDPQAGVPWSVLTALVLGAIALATGAALGSAQQVARWSTWESVLAAVLAGVVGVLFWAWGLFWNVLDVIKNGIPGYGMAVRDLF